MLQVGLDVRGFTLWLPFPRHLPESEDGAAGLRQGGAVDPGRHPVQNPLPASEVTDAQSSAASCRIHEDLRANVIAVLASKLLFSSV